MTDAKKTDAGVGLMQAINIFVDEMARGIAADTYDYEEQMGESMDVTITPIEFRQAFDIAKDTIKKDHLKRRCVQRYERTRLRHLKQHA